MSREKPNDQKFHAHPLLSISKSTSQVLLLSACLSGLDVLNIYIYIPTRNHGMNRKKSICSAETLCCLLWCFEFLLLSMKLGKGFLCCWSLEDLKLQRIMVQDGRNWVPMRRFFLALSSKQWLAFANTKLCSAEAKHIQDWSKPTSFSCRYKFTYRLT